MNHWYVLQCKSRQEDRARQHIENQGYLTCLPQRKVSKLVRGKRQVSSEALFPGYLFIEVNSETANFNAIRSTRGVRGMVRFGGIPARIPDSVIQCLQSDSSALSTVEDELLPGMAVQIMSGPFKGLDAVYSISKGEERCLVLLSMMGKQQQLEVQQSALEKL